MTGAALVAAAATGACAAWAVRGRASNLFGPSVWRGNRARPEIALTFDDGPSESTPRVLDLLDRHNAKATFFQCGRNAERLPEIAKLASAAGHSIGNHTHSHPSLWLRSPKSVFEEIARAQHVLEQVHGAAPKYFRAPYGVRWFGLRAAQQRFQLLSVMWTVIGLDWKLSAPAIAQRVLAGACPGAILCLHDGRELRHDPDIAPTLDALAVLLPALASRGLRLAPLDRLLY